ncbi:ribosome assembly cofactor RimP [Sphingobacterium sp. DK4209]|uniref:Ribosome maturation factor RimP n=1 Tax=Sphingobacterium zhuxiongii TaxID=2662364 RepID=A0A5Q0QHG0_9SPHI|nr:MULTISPECIES: ribosome assembly cofactor RimP [unclassified Sphingobacterium]MVZ67079.1 ribosome assembly cofactor RimP [Sphingobacterium sp. DK4209]QGA26850.1 ribosome assembly cofactor RimP [Sphingobacterium sp. dk4302]
MQVEERVKELVLEKIADREDLFIVSIRFLKSGVLEILLDGDNGIAIEDCVQVSRHVGFHLEEENVIDKAYRLEVSSPGIDTPLLLSRQYQKNIGRNVKVLMLDGAKREGKLLDAGETSFNLEEIVKEKGKKAQSVEVEIPYNQIKETKVLISFK